MSDVTQPLPRLPRAIAFQCNRRRRTPWKGGWARLSPHFRGLEQSTETSVRRKGSAVVPMVKMLLGRTVEATPREKQAPWASRQGLRDHSQNAPASPLRSDLPVGGSMPPSRGAKTCGVCLAFPWECGALPSSPGTGATAPEQRPLQGLFPQAEADFAGSGPRELPSWMQRQQSGLRVHSCIWQRGARFGTGRL